MQIELIATAREDSAVLPRLGLGILAALTPREDEVIYTDDVVKPFDFAKDVKDVDLVGIIGFESSTAGSWPRGASPTSAGGSAATPARRTSCRRG